MIHFWEKNNIRIMGAILGALFHLALIGIVVGGEGQIFLILVFMDFPITLVWSLFIGVVGTGGTPMVVTYFIGGTVMYAILGWLAGGLCNRNNHASLNNGKQN